MQIQSVKGFIRDWLLLMVLITVFGYLVRPDDPFLTGTPTHPYLLVVLLVAIRYGTAAGITSATMLTLLYTLGGLARAGAESTLSPILDSPHSITVSCLFLVAVIAGGFYDTMSSQLKEMAAKGREDKERAKFLEKRKESLEEINLELRSRIMDETTTFQGLYEIAKGLTTLRADKIYPAVLDIFVKFLHVESCSFYLRKGGSQHLVAQRGRAGARAEAEMLAVEEGAMMRRAVGERRVVTLKDFALPGEYVAGDQVVVLPICSQRDGEVIGTVSIEKIPFEHLNAQTVRAVTLIGEWASRALYNSEILSKAKEEAEEGGLLLSKLLAKLEARSLPETAFQEIAPHGTRITPKLGELLLAPGLNPPQKSNLLTVLERLHRVEVHLCPPVCREFAIESLRDWYHLERYRVAALCDKPPGAEPLISYLLERQGQCRIFAGRGLALMMAGDPGLPLYTEIDIMCGHVPLDAELTRLVMTMYGGDREEKSTLTKELWGFGPLHSGQLLVELLESQDPWLRAGSLHCIGMAKDSSVIVKVTESLRDKSPIVREAGVQASAHLLGVCDDKKLMSMLEDMADNDSDPLVREMAKNAVGVGKFLIFGIEKRKKSRSVMRRDGKRLKTSDAVAASY